MLSQTFLSSSCFIILALSGCECARKYDFSRFKNIEPAKDTFKDKPTNSTLKWLTYEDPCTYTEYFGDNRDNATGFCRDSSGMTCRKSKCACQDKRSTQWDPTVQYVIAKKMSKPVYLVNGACAAIKGEQCSLFEGKDGAERARQCMDGLTCKVAKGGSKSKSSRRRRAAKKTTGAESAGDAYYPEVFDTLQDGVCE